MDTLRERRDALWRELLEVEASIDSQRDPTTGKLTALNEAERKAGEYCILLNREHEVVGFNRAQPGTPTSAPDSVYDYVVEDFRAPLRAALDAVSRTGVPQHLVMRARGPHGSACWYSSWAVPCKGPEDGAVAALISFDLTRLRSIEDSLESERRVLKALVADAPDVVAIVDRDLRIQMTNRAPAGFDEANLVGNRVGELLQPDQRRVVQEAVLRSFETGTPTIYRVEVSTPAQGTRWFRGRVGPILRDGKVERVSLVSSDVTEEVLSEQRRVEEAERLRQSEARYRTLVDHAPEAIAIVDLEQQQFVDANQNACELTGLSLEEFLKHGPADLSPEFQPDGTASQALIQEHILATLRGEVSSFEWTVVRSDGASIPTEIRLVLLPGHGRKLMRASVTDISDRKRAETEREQLSEQLLQAQKNEAIGHLTGGFAHDFNNLLTVIINSLDMVLLGGDNPQQVRADAEQALAAAQRSAELTKALLAFARRQPLRPAPVDLNALVRGMERILRRTLGEDVSIETALEEALWTAEVDAAQLESALLNLTINARDAMPNGGKLTIETANAVLDPEYAHAHQEVKPGQYALLAVSDSGTGMAPEVVAKAFEPFFTTKEVGRGSGLGLSMIFGFVKQSGGHVKIYSELGEGTTIRIYLPRFCGDADHVEELAGASTTLTGEGRTVLVVEDEVDLQALLARMLAQMGFRTLSAHNAAEALELIQSEPEIALLVTDVVLPGGKNGGQLAREAQELRPEMPTLFMSGYTENAIIHNGRLDTGVTLLEKPFNQHQLNIALAKVLGGNSA